MKQLIITLAVCLCTLLVTGQNQSDSLNMVIIETSDGNEYTGIIISEDEQQIQLQTRELGVLSIQKSNIAKFTRIDSLALKDGQIWPENNQATRYFWSPTGYGLRRGEAYYQNLWVLFNQMSFGLSDNFSLGFGIVPLFLFSLKAAEYSPIWITPKFSIPIEKDKFNIGLGVLAGTVGFKEDAGFGIAYGVATIGDRSNNVTMGLGYGYAGGKMQKRPVINLGAMIRTGRKGYLLTENYIITGDNTVVLISVGGRTVLRKIGLDYGLFIPFEEDISLAFPWLGLNLPFTTGKKKID